LVLSFVKPYRSAIIAMVVIVGVLYLALIPAAMNVYGVDPNSGFRMVQTTDALSASIQSHGLGVGYGKETSKVDLTELVDTARTELAMNGVHNAFAEAFMRLGVLGGLFLLWLCVGTCAPPREGPLHLRRHLAAVYLMLLTAVLFNVALESPTYIVGVSTAIGYILATKDSLAQPDSEYRSAQDRRIQASGLQPGVLS
jgi:O-antigen ligase